MATDESWPSKAQAVQVEQVFAEGAAFEALDGHWWENNEPEPIPEEVTTLEEVAEETPLDDTAAEEDPATDETPPEEATDAPADEAATE